MNGVASTQQRSWDARAAANFVCGGAGAGLIVLTALSGVRGNALALLVLCGLALVGTGLLCVWHELGRPLRALHVFFHPRTSWMSREAFVATLLFPAGLAAAARVPGFMWASAVLAVAFLVCQARMLQAARGIPAWRAPLAAPLLVLTGLAEGGGLLLIASPWLGAATPASLALFAGLVLLRVIAWVAYRRALGATAAPRALTALDRAGRVLHLAGSLAPLALIATIAMGALGGTAALAAGALAGACAVAGGWYLKYTLIMRAGFTQGFALAKLPVRGARRDAPPLRDSGRSVDAHG
ncbi:MAG TPA: phenylacetyl-CoA:acceptor oxidoreductase [Casimicrobiaceae bacterium]